MEKNKNKTCVLIKKFRGYPDKVIYEGTLRGAKKRIPPSKKAQYKIIFKGKK